MAFKGKWNPATTYLSSAKAKSGRATRQEIANDKLIDACPTKGYLGNRMQCGIRCGDCVHFAECEPFKGISASMDYCVYRPSRYKGVTVYD